MTTRATLLAFGMAAASLGGCAGLKPSLEARIAANPNNPGLTGAQWNDLRREREAAVRSNCNPGRQLCSSVRPAPLPLPSPGTVNRAFLPN